MVTYIECDTFTHHSDWCWCRKIRDFPIDNAGPFVLHELCMCVVFHFQSMWQLASSTKWINIKCLTRNSLLNLSIILPQHIPFLIGVHLKKKKKKDLYFLYIFISSIFRYALGCYDKRKVQNGLLSRLQQAVIPKEVQPRSLFNFTATTKLCILK